MSYEALIAALLEEGEAKRNEVLNKARLEAERIIAEAAAAAETLERETDRRTRHELDGRRAAALSQASLARRQILLQAKHDVLEAVWRRVTEMAMALTGHKRARVARALLEELLAVAPPGPFTVIIDRRERASLAPCLEERRLPFEERERDDLVLGAELVGSGEILRTSLATRVAKARPRLLVELNRLLFSEEQASGKKQEARGAGSFYAPL